MDVTLEDLDIDLWYYVRTPGCFVIADEYNNFVVCHRCNKEEPTKVDLDGEDLYVRFLTGDMAYLVDLATNVKCIVFDRFNAINKYKIYEYERFKRKIQGLTK